MGTNKIVQVYRTCSGVTFCSNFYFEGIAALFRLFVCFWWILKKKNRKNRENLVPHGRPGCMAWVSHCARNTERTVKSI